jgi:hypothetical protein
VNLGIYVHHFLSKSQNYNKPFPKMSKWVLEPYSMPFLNITFQQFCVLHGLHSSVNSWIRFKSIAFYVVDHWKDVIPWCKNGVTMLTIISKVSGVKDVIPWHKIGVTMLTIISTKLMVSSGIICSRLSQFAPTAFIGNYTSHIFCGALAPLLGCCTFKINMTKIMSLRYTMILWCTM